MIFSQQLRAHRQLLKLKQSQIAGLLDVSVRTYQHWESGSSIPYAVTQEGALARLENAGSTTQKLQ